MPTHPVLPEEQVRLQVQQRIETGRLPLLRPNHIHAGYGSGNICCACDQLIDPTKIEYEIATPDTARKLNFHFACYVVWQRECSQRMDERSRSRPEMPERKPPAPGKSRKASARFHIHALLCPAFVRP